jgi:hypothetical protein
MAFKSAKKLKNKVSISVVIVENFCASFSSCLWRCDGIGNWRFPQEMLGMKFLRNLKKHSSWCEAKKLFELVRGV